MLEGFEHEFGLDMYDYGEKCYRGDMYDLCIDEYQIMMDKDGCGECNGYDKDCPHYKSLEDVGWDYQSNLELFLEEVKNEGLYNGFDR